MFEYKYKVPKAEQGTTYGSICIRNIVFEPEEIEKVLPQIVFDDENIKHMFAEENLDNFNRKNIYRRFIPKLKVDTDLSRFIEDSIKDNVSFYSFLAEGILGLIFRDLYKYQLAKAVIDVYDTLNDSHTGVDACMYDMDSGVIVLGEAKFYENLEAGIKKIIADFTQKSIKNKLESLQVATENSHEASRIILKNLAVGDYDILTLDEFMNQKIMFAGFVLHSEDDVSEYKEKSFYDKYNISIEQLVENIEKAIKTDITKGDYEIIMVHLPVSSKKSLIAKVIETSRLKLKEMSDAV